MLNNKTFGLAALAVAALFLAAEPAMAQSRVGGGGRAPGAAPRSERVLPGRVGGDRTDRQEQEERRQQRGRREEPAVAMTAEQIQAEAQAVLTATGQQCQMTEAVHPGLINEAKVFEVACADAAGRILIASTPPQAFDCLELAGSAAIARAADPNADVGQQCSLPANQNAPAVLGGYAREAGLTCTVDEAAVIGKSGDNMVYEIGCAGADGARLERQPTGWVITDCLQIVTSGSNCRYTTTAEQLATLKAQLQGSDASACDVAEFRVIGMNANGRFIEVKCAAEGEGYIARVKDGATQQIYPCATAQRIGGGCTLTPAPTAAPAAE